MERVRRRLPALSAEVASVALALSSCTSSSNGGGAAAGTGGLATGGTTPIAGAPGAGTGGVSVAGAGGAVATAGGAATPTAAGGSAGATGGAAGGPAGAGGNGAGGASGGAGGALPDASLPDSGAPDAGTDGGDYPRHPVSPPVAGGCVVDVSAGTHEFSCDTTTHMVTVPEICTRLSCGVIVDVHGGSMSADMEDKNTNLRALGARYGYLVVQPNALPNPLLLGERVFVAGADDDRVMHILNDVVTAFHADTSRIHMMGFSEGGFMTWRWICAHSDLLASAAPAAAGYGCTVLPITEEIGCRFAETDAGTEAPARHMPILYMQGVNDKLMNPDCTFSWLESNVYPTLMLDQGTKIAGDATYERTRFLDPGGVSFELIRHQYSTDASFFGVAVGGHCYPGSTDLTATLPGQLMGFGCKDTCSFTWSEEAIRFFIAHPKR
jgi:hypothetical protein